MLKQWLSRNTTGLFLAGLFLFTAFLFYVISTYTLIGRGDGPNYSNVARSLIQGRGFTVDYFGFHFIPYDSLSHPEDMWPILQPVWIAISYLIFGVSTFSARVPNVLFFAALIYLTYYTGKKLFSPTIGLWAALLTAFNWNLFLYSTAWITSDVALAVFSLITFLLTYSSVQEIKAVGEVSWKKVLCVGVIGALAHLQKPVGALLPIMYTLTLLYYYRSNLKKIVKPFSIIAIVSLLIAGPFVLRNYLLFGTLFLPSEEYMGYLIKYAYYEDIYKIFHNDPPSIQLWFDQGLAHFVKVNWDFFRYAVDAYIFKEPLVPQVILGLSVLGFTQVKDKANQYFNPVLILIGVITILLATYWHFESRYYAMFIPIINILSGVALFSFIKTWGIKNVLIIGAILALSLLPSLKVISKEAGPKEKDPSLVAYEWINNNTKPDDVIMGLTTWELNFHTNRKAMTIPNNTVEEIFWFAKKYSVDYLELHYLNEIRRPQLEHLYKGASTPEFELVFNNPGKTLIYKFNWENINLDENTKPEWY